MQGMLSLKIEIITKFPHYFLITQFVIITLWTSIAVAIAAFVLLVLPKVFAGDVCIDNDFHGFD